MKGFVILLPHSPFERVHKIPMDTNVCSAQQVRELLGLRNGRIDTLLYGDVGSFELHVTTSHNAMAHVNEAAAQVFCMIDDHPEDILHHMRGNVVITGADNTLLTWEEASAIMVTFIDGGGPAVRTV